MKQFKLSFLIFVLMSMLGNKAWADGSCGDGVVWSLSGTDLTITYTGSGTGKMTDYELTTKPWGSNITSVVIGDGVTSIGARAFAYCTGLTSIEIPNSVTSIGTFAFGCCSGMTSITVESGNTVYDSRNNCNAIIETSSNTLITGCKATVIPSSVTSIGDDAFYGCTGLTSIEIPNSVTSIGRSAFAYCTGLTSIEIPNSVTSIGAWAFEYCTGLTSIKIPNSVTSIVKSAFEGCTGLTSIEIPSGMTSIGEDAFRDCTSLNSIEIPSSVTSIGNRAFHRCKSLTSIEIPNSVTSIGSEAFYGCTGLTSIMIPSSVTSIGGGAFGSTNISTLHLNCSNIGNWFASIKTKIKTVILGDSVKTIGREAFEGFEALTSITIGNSVTSIGNFAFYGCTGLASVTIPNSVTIIGDGAFYGCTSLASVTIPNGVTSIGDWAFYGCTGLASVTIPNSVTSIGDSAFSGCSSIAELNIDCKLDSKWLVDIKATLKKLILGDNVETIAAEAFNGFTALTQVILGKSVGSIDAKAFANCSKLEDVYCYAVRYPVVSKDAFENSYVDFVTLHVPAQSLENYKNHALWGTFKNIVAIDEGPVVEEAILTYTIDGYSTMSVEVKTGRTAIAISPKEGWKVAALTVNDENGLRNYSDGKLTIDIEKDTKVSVTFAWANDENLYTEDVETGIATIEGENVQVRAKDGQIWVNGAAGKTVRLYTIGGSLITSITPQDGMTGKFTVAAGTYIVQVGSKAAKIVVR